METTIYAPLCPPQLTTRVWGVQAGWQVPQATTQLSVPMGARARYHRKIVTQYQLIILISYFMSVLAISPIASWVSLFEQEEV